MPKPPRLSLRLVDRRQALHGLLGGTAGLALAACTGDSSGDSGGPDRDLETIPPITPNEDFYVTSCCDTPQVDGASWRLLFSDAAGVELGSIDLAGLEALGGRGKEHTLECIGTNPLYQGISNAVWTGLPLGEVLEALGVQVPKTALELLMIGADDYSTSVPIGDLDSPMWLVWRMNGVALPVEHGYPARLLTPGRYGTKNPKWPVELRFVDEPVIGYWESVGWSNSAEYRPNTLIAAPRYELEHPPGPLRFLGTAFAGRDPVTRVQLSLDGGASWTDCVRDYAPGADIWTLWHFDWEATEGTWDVRVRCTTASGAMSAEDPEGSDRYSGYDGSMQVQVTIG